MWTRGCTLRSTSGRLGGQYILSAEVPLPFMQDNGRAEREPITVSYTVLVPLVKEQLIQTRQSASCGRDVMVGGRDSEMALLLDDRQQLQQEMHSTQVAISQLEKDITRLRADISQIGQTFLSIGLSRSTCIAAAASLCR